MNAFASYTHADTATAGAEGGTGIDFGIAKTPSLNAEGKYGSKQVGINTGLLPAWLGFTGTTRQNDLDVSFTISIQPNVSSNGATGDGAGNSGPNSLFRQA